MPICLYRRVQTLVKYQPRYEGKIEISQSCTLRLKIVLQCWPAPERRRDGGSVFPDAGGVLALRAGVPRQRRRGCKLALASPVHLVPFLRGQLHRLQQDGGDDRGHGVHHAQGQAFRQDFAGFEGEVTYFFKTNSHLL